MESLSGASLETDTIKPFFNDGKFFYENVLSNKLIVNEGFTEAYPFIKGYAVIKKGGNYGIIDRSGKIIVNPEYKSFYLEDFGAKIVFGEYEFDYFSGKLTDYSFRDVERYFPQNTIYKSNHKFGIKFQSGYTTPAVYDTVLSAEYEKFAVVKKGNKLGVIDRKGNYIIPLKYDGFKEGYPEQFALKKNTSWDYYKNGELIFNSGNIPVYWRYDKIIFRSGDYYGCMDEKGTQILAAKYKWISLVGPVAINSKNQVVFYSKGKQDFVYYTFIGEKN